MSEERGKVIGLGGIFIKSPDKARLAAWYAEKLGMRDEGQGISFPWNAVDPKREPMSVWTIFPESTAYFNPSKSSFMVNLLVDDLDALLERLRAGGVEIDPKRDDYDFGRFAWIYDPDGNKVELWEPPTAKKD